MSSEVVVHRVGPLTLNVPTPRTFDPIALALAVAGFVGIVRVQWSMIAVVLGSGAIGLVLRLL